MTTGGSASSTDIQVFSLPTTLLWMSKELHSIIYVMDGKTSWRC